MGNKHSSKDEEIASAPGKEALSAKKPKIIINRKITDELPAARKLRIVKATSPVSPPQSTVPTKFQWKEPAEEVSLVGLVDGIEVKYPMTRKENVFEAELALKKGAFDFVFLVNGQRKYSKKYLTFTQRDGSIWNKVSVFVHEQEKATKECKISETAEMTGSRIDLAAAKPLPLYYKQKFNLNLPKSDKLEKPVHFRACLLN